MESGIESIWHGWKTVKLLGEGSFGKVFEIERNGYGFVERSALKVIPIPASTAEMQSLHEEGMTLTDIEQYYESLTKEFSKEISLMAKLRGHANIVGYEDYAVIERKDMFGWDIYIRMELLTSLPNYIDAHADFGVDDIVKMAVDLCSALESCYAHRIVHRDIKPANVFVAVDGTYKLGDFGVAKTIDKTVSGLSKKGTYTYMAPEIYKGNPGGTNSDLYSLGIMIYKLLNDNREPFLPPSSQNIDFTHKQQALVKRMNGERFNRPKYGNDALWAIVQKACECDPTKRYQTPTEMKRELLALGRQKDKTESAVFLPKAPIEQSVEYVVPSSSVREGTTASKIVTISLMCLVALAVLIGVIILGITVFNTSETPSDIATTATTVTTTATTRSTAKDIDDWQADNSITDDSALTEEELAFSYPDGMDPSFKKLYYRNSDIRGWLSFHSTDDSATIDIEYPIMQSSDNAFYAFHDFNKEYNANGSLYFDYRNDFKSQYATNYNTIVYGNNMASGQMFANLNTLLSGVDAAKLAPTFTMNTLYASAQYKVFAVMLINTNAADGHPFDCSKTQFSDVADYTDFLANICARSLYNYGDVDLQNDDEIIMLTTDCPYSYAHFSDARVVVVARKVRQGEDISTDVSKITRNDDVIMPYGWYIGQHLEPHAYYTDVSYTIPPLRFADV